MTINRQQALARLTIKWQSASTIRGLSEKHLNSLLRFGLAEAGADVVVIEHLEDGSKSRETLRFVFTGDEWSQQLNLTALQHATLKERKKVAVKCLTPWLYLRLTLAGEQVLETRRWPKIPVSFEAQRVDYFDERETEEERQRLDAVAEKHLYYIEKVGKTPKKLNATGLTLFVTRNGIRQRVTGEEFERLCSEVSRVVVGEQHEEFQRTLIAGLWPDLVADIELSGSTAAFRKASDRLKSWLGIAIPHCHRDWRTLAELVDLQPAEISDKWLQEFLYPRLVAKWRKNPNGAVGRFAVSEQNQADDTVTDFVSRNSSDGIAGTSATVAMPEDTRNNLESTEHSPQAAFTRRQSRWHHFAEWYLDKFGDDCTAKQIRLGIAAYREKHKNRVIPSESQAKHAVRHRKQTGK